MVKDLTFIGRAPGNSIILDSKEKTYKQNPFQSLPI